VALESAAYVELRMLGSGGVGQNGISPAAIAGTSLWMPLWAARMPPEPRGAMRVLSNEGARGRGEDCDLARRHGVSEATLYNWKAKYGGMDVSEAKRLKQLEEDNAKLKKLLAEQTVDAAALRELLSKEW
jgi:putative transposase